MPFQEGQYVRMLVPSVGCDADDVERVYPVGSTGYIDTIDERGIHHVVVGPLFEDESIVQCFKRGAEADLSMEVIPVPKIGLTVSDGSHDEGMVFSSLDEAAVQAAKFIRGIPLDAIGADYRVSVELIAAEV